MHSGEYLIPVRFPFAGSEAFRAGIKKFPGVAWQKESKVWLVPKELLAKVGDLAIKLAIKLDVRLPSDGKTYYDPFAGEPRLYPFQRKAAYAAFWSKNWILGDEMGLGKTPEAIVVAKAANCQNILVVTRAIVREHWRAQFDEWWPGHPEIGVIDVGAKRSGLSKRKIAARDLAYAAPIQIVSYALVDQVPKRKLDLLILDEAHSVKDPASLQSQVVRELSLYAGGPERFLALTGTLVPNEPKDAWNVLDLLWPGRFGTSRDNTKIAWSFLNRYTNKEDNGYGVSYTGANIAHSEELRSRIATCGSFTTKAEVAHLLPPYQVGLLPLPAGLTAKPPPMTFGSWKEAQEELCANTAEKLPHIKEWAEMSFDNGATHLAVMTYKRESAKQIADALLGFGADVSWITGEMAPGNRNAALALAKAAPKSIIVCTMDSVGIGIDLTFATQALFAELSYKWVTIDQALGRFSRLSGKQPSDVRLMVLPNSFEEKVARGILAKVGEINMVAKASDTSTKTTAALSEARNDDAVLASIIENLAG